MFLAHATGLPAEVAALGRLLRTSYLARRLSMVTGTTDRRRATYRCAALYASTTLAGMRPRVDSSYPFLPAHCRTALVSTSLFDREEPEAPVLRGRRPPTRRPCFT